MIPSLPVACSVAYQSSTDACQPLLTSPNQYGFVTGFPSLSMSVAGTSGGGADGRAFQKYTSLRLPPGKRMTLGRSRLTCAMNAGWSIIRVIHELALCPNTVAGTFAITDEASTVTVAPAAVGTATSVNAG